MSLTVLISVDRGLIIVLGPWFNRVKDTLHHIPYWCHSSVSAQLSCASSQDQSVSFKSHLTLLMRFIPGHPGLVFIVWLCLSFHSLTINFFPISYCGTVLQWLSGCCISDMLHLVSRGLFTFHWKVVGCCVGMPLRWKYDSLRQFVRMVYVRIFLVFGSIFGLKQYQKVYWACTVTVKWHLAFVCVFITTVVFIVIQWRLYVVSSAPRGAGALPFPLVPSLPHLLLFFYFFLFSLVLTIFFFCPSLYFLPE